MQMMSLCCEGFGGDLLVIFRMLILSVGFITFPLTVSELLCEDRLAMGRLRLFGGPLHVIVEG